MIANVKILYVILVILILYSLRITGTLSETILDDTYSLQINKLDTNNIKSLDSHNKNLTLQINQEDPFLVLTEVEDEDKIQENLLTGIANYSDQNFSWGDFEFVEINYQETEELLKVPSQDEEIKDAIEENRGR